jgi:3-dehydroquinate dehydratase type I
MNGLLEGLKLGGTLGDIMGDTFDRSPNELAKNPTAIDKQKKLIDEIHNMGKSVLMSSHLYRYAEAEEVLDIAYEHQKRGADIAKIVTVANSEAEEAENIRITSLLKKELKIPFLFLSGGTHYKVHRLVSPMLGSCMSLCVWQYDELATRSQPPLKFVRFVTDNMDYTLDR